MLGILVCSRFLALPSRSLLTTTLLSWIRDCATVNWGLPKGVKWPKSYLTTFSLFNTSLVWSMLIPRAVWTRISSRFLDWFRIKETNVFNFGHYDVSRENWGLVTLWNLKSTWWQKRTKEPHQLTQNCSKVELSQFSKMNYSRNLCEISFFFQENTFVAVL